MAPERERREETDIACCGIVCGHTALEMYLVGDVVIVAEVIDLCVGCRSLFYIALFSALEQIHCALVDRV